MTFTKILGGFCGAFLIFLLGKLAAEGLYHTGGGHGDHGQQAYVIDTGIEETVEEEVIIDVAAVLAAGDAAKGSKLWNKCRSCHKIEDGANGTGPHLWNVVGRDVDAVDGYGYSGALSAVADVWTPEALYAFLANPKGFAPGTKMSFKGFAKPEDKANLIAYLSTNGS